MKRKSQPRQNEHDPELKPEKKEHAPDIAVLLYVIGGDVLLLPDRIVSDSVFPPATRNDKCEHFQRSRS